MTKIGVIGAGVIGLLTANAAQEHVVNAKVTIIAEKHLSGTTSHGSGGIFRCGSTTIAPDSTVALKWLSDSRKSYWKLLGSSEGKTAGLLEFPLYMYSDDDRFKWSPVLAQVMPDYRNLTPEEMKSAPASAGAGTACTTLSVQMDKFLPWAMERFKKKGGVLVQRKIANFFELIPEDFDVVINCAGIGARWLADDQLLEPIRGQVFKVEAPWIKAGCYVGLDTYIIPNIDHVTVGGTRNYGSWDLRVDPYDSQSIWNRATTMCPLLTEGRVIEEWVGLRPHRIPVRLEKEILRDGNKTVKIVHNYGHGGYGVTLAPGTAWHAVHLAMQILDGDTKNNSFSF